MPKLPKREPSTSGLDEFKPEPEAQQAPAAEEVAAETPAPTPPVAPEPPKRTGGTRSSDKLFGSLQDDDEYYNWFLYGLEGSGKTTAACKASVNGRILVIRAEGGLKKTPLKAQGCKLENIEVYPKQQGEQITAEGLEEVHRRLLSDLMKNPGCWYAVVFDSISEIHQGLREQATDKRIEKMRATNKPVDPDFVDRDDYGVMTNQLRKLVRRYRDLPCHTIITGLQKVDDDTKQNRPHVSPALCNDLLGYVDVVTAHKADDGEFRALTSLTEKTRAKDRFGMLPRVWFEPDFPRLVAYLSGEFESGGDDLQDAYDGVLEQRRLEAEKAAAEREAAKKERTATRRPTKTAAKAAAPKEGQ